MNTKETGIRAEYLGKPAINMVQTKHYLLLPNAGKRLKNLDLLKSVVEPLVEKRHVLCHSQALADADVDRWQPTNRSPGHGWPPL